MPQSFRTELLIPPCPFEISEKQPLLWMGSCFAESMGERLKEAKFPVLVNPFGTVFNPLSIFQQIRDALHLTPPHEDKFLSQEELWYHYDYHSTFRASKKQALKDLLTHLQSQVHTHLLSCEYLVLTFGTAWVYRLDTHQEVVANCHKQATQLFTKHLLEVEEIKTAFLDLYQDLHQLCPDVKILLTLSPVRHLKDTLPLNAVSKAVLRLAIHQLCTSLEDVFYFPAYELVLDDLRDYRFFGEDMLHPNPQAQQYVWEKFQTACLSSSAKDWLKVWAMISKALAHRPFNPSSVAHQQFLRNTLEKIHEHHPKIDLSQEIAWIEAQLIAPF